MVEQISRVILIILDSVGCGDAPDAAAYGDEDSNTLGNIANTVGGLNLPNMAALGLGNVASIQGVPPVSNASGVYGRLTEVRPIQKIKYTREGVKLALQKEQK
ncbi:hypothetical protein KFU94_07260 [Chloroflexi bacterium TSY]|nr:hypothetical protein [Chloroflexi bacterium TSY]